MVDDINGLLQYMLNIVFEVEDCKLMDELEHALDAKQNIFALSEICK